MNIQRNGKYSCLELERRFLVHDLPEEIRASGYRWRISDRYIPETRLRLRRMESRRGAEVLYKLSQKFSDQLEASRKTTITNLYLNEGEYNCLQTLAGNEVLKDRYLFEYKKHRFGIDVFAGRHAGLILAEVEAATEIDLDDIPIPSFLVREVTEEPFFTGGKLAEASQAELRKALQS